MKYKCFYGQLCQLQTELFEKLAHTLRTLVTFRYIGKFMQDDKIWSHKKLQKNSEPESPEFQQANQDNVGVQGGSQSVNWECICIYSCSAQGVSFQIQLIKEMCTPSPQLTF